MPFDVEWIEFGWPLSPNGQPEGRWGRDVDFVAWSRAFEKLDAGGRRRFTPAGGLCRPGLTTAGWGPWPARFRAALVLTYDAGVAGLLGRGLVLALIEERFEPGGLRAFRRSVHYLLPEEWADSPQPAALPRPAGGSWRIRRARLASCGTSQRCRSPGIRRRRRSCRGYPLPRSRTRAEGRSAWRTAQSRL